MMRGRKSSNPLFFSEKTPAIFQISKYLTYNFTFCRDFTSFCTIYTTIYTKIVHQKDVFGMFSFPVFLERIPKRIWLGN